MDDQPHISYAASELALAHDERDSGLEIIGAVPWGTHFCQFYATSQDLIETLVPYFKAGLEGNEFCMWVTSAPLQREEALAALRAASPEMDRYLETGQIEILDYSQWYTPTGRFDADAVLQGWSEKLANARQRGLAGLRLSGNTFWLEQSTWNDFKLYEEKINRVIGELNMLALCTYSLEKCGAREILDVVSNHQFALIKNQGQWEIIESAEHKKMEQALRESEERLRLAVRAADLGVFEWDILNDQAVWENQRMYEIFGRAPQAGSLNKSHFFAGGLLPEDAHLLETAIAEGMQPGCLFHAICRFRAPGRDDLQWLEISGRFKRNAHGEPVILSGVVEDITARKLDEIQLKENAARLEQLNRELEEFTYVASHDLQEPLRKISAFGDRILARAAAKLDDEEQDYLDRMIQGARRLQSMVDQLLAYSRLATRAAPKSRVDLEEVAAAVLSDLVVRLEESRGLVEVSALPQIEADPLQMRQLLQNLVSNGLKFHLPDRPPRVKVSSRELPGNRVEIVVEDQGIGFDMQLADQLFRPFQRLVGRSDYEGAGIGLAICQKIVDNHKGSITARSDPGQGAVFTVILPVEQ